MTGFHIQRNKKLLPCFNFIRLISCTSKAEVNTWSRPRRPILLLHFTTPESVFMSTRVIRDPLNQMHWSWRDQFRVTVSSFISMSIAVTLTSSQSSCNSCGNCINRIKPLQILEKREKDFHGQRANRNEAKSHYNYNLLQMQIRLLKTALLSGQSVTKYMKLQRHTYSKDNQNTCCVDIDP